MGYALRELHPPRIDGKTYLATRITKWRPRLVKKWVPREELKIEAAAVALKRIREYMFELGDADRGLERGWMMYVSEKTGIPYNVTREIIHGDKVELTLYIAQRFQDKTGIPLHILYDTSGSR